MYKRIGCCLLACLLVSIPISGTQAATPQPPPTPVATTVRSTDDAVMVYVPAGEFLMGSAEGGDPDEHPQHVVSLDAYWIDRTEVTNRQFGRFVDATGYRTDAEKEGYGSLVSSSSTYHEMEGADWRHPEGPGSDLSGRMEEPVLQVSWNDARAFCEWAGARLPTEAEWEKAARGTDARLYPWGDESSSCEYAVIWETGVGKACGQGDKPWPVGGKPQGASPYGALDMTGNVWEWTADWYDPDYYAHSPARNPLGPVEGQQITSRGGCWSNTCAYGKSATRDSDYPNGRSNVDGFRCAAYESALSTAAAEPIRSVLFIGDTHSYWLAYYFPKLVAASDTPVEIDATEITMIGGSLAIQWSPSGPKTKKMAQGQWDVVVLEEDIEGHTPAELTMFADAVSNFCSVIEQGDAIPVLFAAVAPSDASQATVDAIIDTYKRMGADLGARVAPVAEAFERAQRERPDLKLHADDGVHASAPGYYLTLCVLYGTVFDRSPEGLSYRMSDIPFDKGGYRWDVSKDWMLADEDAAILQQIAWATVQDYRELWRSP